MSKKLTTENKEVSKQKVKKVAPISFELPYEIPFYILELSNDDNYYVFNTLDGAVEYLDKKDNLDTKDTKLLSFNRAEEQFSVSQITWADIYKISRDLRKKGG